MLKLRIVSPEKVEFDGEVLRVKVPGKNGNFEILENHAPIISSLQEGVVEYTTTEGTVTLAVLGGFAEVQKNMVSVCIEKQLQ